MPDPISAMAGSQLIGGFMGSSAAKKAAKTQADAARYAADIQMQMYNQARADLAPYRGLGYQALSEIGGGMAGRQPIYDEKGNITGYQTGTGYFTGQLTPEQIASYLDPSMAFRMQYGTQATERLSNVSGGATSGNTMRALQEFGQGLASTEYGNAFNRAQAERTNIYNTLANIAGMGQGATNTGVSLSAANAQNLGQLAIGAAQSQAAGQIGSANAWSNAFGNIGNAAFMSQYLKQQPSTVAAAGGYSITPQVSQNLADMGGAQGLQAPAGFRFVNIN